MTSQYVTTEDLGLDIPLPENNDAYYTPGEGGAVPTAPSFEKDLAPLDTDTTTSDADDATPPAGDTGDVEFDTPAPIANWQQRAEKEGFTGVTTEAEFREQLILSDYVQRSFFGDPDLAAAYQILSMPAEDEKTPKMLLEHDIRQKMQVDEDLDEEEIEEEVEAKLSKYFDEDGELTDKGKKKAGQIRQRLDKTVAETVSNLEVQARDYVEQSKEFETTLQADIRALPADTFTAADKRDLDRYIRSGQYERDALITDQNGKPLLAGKELAKKVLENAMRINPVFEQKRQRLLYEDAKKMGVDEYIKKHFQ